MVAFNWSDGGIFTVLRGSARLLSSDTYQYEYLFLIDHVMFIRHLISNITDKGKGLGKTAYGCLSNALNKSLLNNSVVEGKDGRPGKDGFDICKWMPLFTLTQFQKSVESCCFLISNPETDLRIDEEGKVVKWLSRSDIKNNAEAVKPSKTYTKIAEGRWGLNFDKTLYIVRDFSLSYDSCILACVTFQINSDDEQMIFNDFDGEEGEVFRGISASRSNIYIWGVDNESSYIAIPHELPKNTWHTVLVEWLPEIYGRRGTYNINNYQRVGSFVCNELGFVSSDRLYLGAMVDSKKSLSGAISAFEGLWSEEIAPDNIKDLIIQGQYINIEKSV